MIGVYVGVGSPNFMASGSSGGATDPIIQALIDGDYDGADVDEFIAGTGFPYPEIDVQLTHRVLATPAAPIGNLIDSTHISLDCVSASALVLARSPDTDVKYLVITKSGKPTLYLSVGTPTSDFGAEVQYPDPGSTSLDWYIRDTVTFSSLTAAAITEVITHYAVTPSTLTPLSEASYTARAQAKDVSNSDVHRIGLQLTPSTTLVSGTGGGDVAEAFVRTNVYGLSEILHAMAGTYPTTEKIHVTDGTLTGDSANVVIVDLVDSYIITASNYGPGRGQTITITAQARRSGSNVSVSGRTITWSKNQLDGSFDNPTSVTDGSGVATVQFTVGTTIATAYLITGTDVQGSTGTSSAVTIARWTLLAYAIGAGGFSGDSVGPIDTTSADLILRIISTYNPITVDDTETNTWTLKSSNGGGAPDCRIYECYNPSTNVAHSFTSSGPFSVAHEIVLVLSGATTSPFDQENHSQSTGSAIQPGSVTPAEDNELIVAGLGFNSVPLPSIDSGFTIVLSGGYNGSGGGVAAAILIQGSAALVNPAWSNLSSLNSACIVTYKAVP